MSRHDPTPSTLRAVPPTAEEPVRFEEHQELVGCGAFVAALLVYAGMLVTIVAALFLLAGGQAGVAP